MTTQALPRDHRSVMASRVTAQDNPDLFLTPPWGGRAGAELILQLDPAARSIWEPACGPGLLVHAFRDYFPVVHASDAYGYGWDHGLYDFLSDDSPPWRPDWIATNPPFGKKVEPFIRLAYARARRGVAMLLQTRNLEGVGRHKLFEDLPLSRVGTFAERLPMHAGRYEPKGTTATSYSWFIFLKPQRRGQPADGSGARLPIPPGTKTRLFRDSDLQFAVAQ